MGWGKNRLKIFGTPGHPPGSACLYDDGQSVLFTGDTIFAGGGVGRTDFSYSDHSRLLSSLEKIFMLPQETIIYPGHGSPSTIGEEKKVSILP